MCKYLLLCNCIIIIINKNHTHYVPGTLPSDLYMLFLILRATL